MGALRLPERLRGEMVKPYGTLFSGDTASNVQAALALIAERPPKVIIVGDFTLRAFIDAGYRPDVGIYDRKTERSAFPLPEEPTLTVPNPPGEISDEAAKAVKGLLEREGPSMLLVDGEEDLLAIPAILYAPEGSLVIYGLPGRGMIAVKADRTLKEKITALLSQFERVDK